MAFGSPSPFDPVSGISLARDATARRGYVRLATT